MSVRLFDISGVYVAYSLLSLTGKDADEMFEDIGHSNEARKTMEKYLVGTVKVSSRLATVDRVRCGTVRAIVWSGSVRCEMV